MLEPVRTQWSSIWAALIGSLAAHSAVAVLVAGTLSSPSRSAQKAPATTVPFQMVMAQDTAVDRSDALPLPGELLDSVRGAANQISPDSASAFPHADVDTPDLLPAGRGGGAVGGPDTYTGRQDGDSLRAQFWDHPNRYAIPRRKNSHRRRSREAIARLKKPGIGQQVSRKHRRARVAKKARGQVSSDEFGNNEQDAESQRDSDARTQRDREGGGQDALVRAAQDGSTRAANGLPLVSAGAEANETHALGRFADNVNAAQASHETRPQILELSQASARGKVPDSGVRGPVQGTGLSALADDRRNSGEGGHRADLARHRRGQTSTHADRQNPYFKRMYARVSSRVSYPDELALMFEQGQVVVRFTLHVDGRVANVRVMSSSGFAAFDSAVVAAIRGAAPFGRLPHSLAQGRRSMRVSAPFDFDNPLIR